MAGQRLDLVVVVVDGLTTSLDVQPVSERKMQRVDPAAHAISGFEHDHIPASGAKRQRCGQPGKPGTHHDYSSLRRMFRAGPGAAALEQSRCHRRAGGAQKLPACQRQGGRHRVMVAVSPGAGWAGALTLTGDERLLLLGK